jgi:hypothetical protein
MSGPPPFALAAAAAAAAHAPRYEPEKDIKPPEPRETNAMDEVARRQVELQRERREPAPGDAQVLHQPVALAPSVRTVHGPNGILGGQGPPPGAHLHGGIGPLFPVSHQQRAPQPPQPQPPPQPMLVPFNPNIQPSAALNPPMGAGGMPGMRDGPMREGPMRDGPLREALSQGAIHTPMNQSPMNHGPVTQSPMNHAPMSQPPMNSQTHNHGQNQTQQNQTQQNQTQQNQPILNVR